MNTVKILKQIPNKHNPIVSKLANFFFDCAINLLLSNISQAFRTFANPYSCLLNNNSDNS